MPVLDRLARPLRDLRISVTDRCNFRCTYCMPRDVFGRDFEFASRSELLTFEEITEVASAFVACGVRKIRLTGGEPLLRRDLHSLVAMLANIGVEDLALTTNGSLLTVEVARQLRDAGLDRVTLSLDSLDDATFRRMNDADFPVARVLDAIDAAVVAGLTPVKIDMVVQRGVNDGDVLSMAERFRHTGSIVRFIEYMDVGNTNGWLVEDVVPASEIVAMIRSRYAIEPADPSYFGEVANRWRYLDGGGEFGVISSVSQPFCSSCTRARLSATGELFTCLFAATGKDIRSIVRAGCSPEELRDQIAAAWSLRTDRYSEIRSSDSRNVPKVEMSRIGG